MNAKNEFLSTIDNFKVIGAKISIHIDDWRDAGVKEFSGEFKLPLLYTDEEYQSFLKFLDREYDDGYGGQELFGIILCEDGVWMDRGEYDGSEWWIIHDYPDLNDIFGEKLATKYLRKKKLDEIGE